MASKLCLLFWFLLFHHQRPSMSSPILKYGCRPGTPQECKEAKFVPGHTLLGEGINIVTMEATGSFLLDLQDAGEKCTVCDNPHNNNVLQKLPKAMADWRPGSSCSRSIQSSMSTVSVADEVTSVVQNDWTVGLDLNTHAVDIRRAVGGSQSQVAQFANGKSVIDNYSFLSHKLECIYYSFRLGSNASLTPHFEKSLEELPDSYNAATKTEYRRLIDSFGTHYITHAKVGGRTQEVTAVRTCLVALDGLTIDDIMDCLAVEADIGFEKGDNSKLERCKNKLTKPSLGGSFHRAFNERVWRVIGGNGTFDLLFSDKATADAFKKWMESLRSSPGLVSYSLDSIHNLVVMNNPKKENLRLAISDYIKEKAVLERCSCSGRRVISKGNDCSCTCTASKYTSSDCCPTSLGVAKLHVTINSASLPRADFWSQTDAYVIFKFDGASIRTKTILNTNDPTWNVQYDLGLVDLREGKSYTIEVWDEDHEYDDFMGKCEKVLRAGDTSDSCYVYSGSLRYSTSVTCADHLGGRYCQDYIPVPPSV
ncbi:perforin-1-like [Dendropsophus ebraccatus]|uniref:perforin-1-like n=1 Tax=Dendropsophus ebraccatus TaxID=150705 RepID=UPI0038315AEC